MSDRLVTGEHFPTDIVEVIRIQECIDEGDRRVRTVSRNSVNRLIQLRVPVAIRCVSKFRNNVGVQGWVIATEYTGFRLHLANEFLKHQVLVFHFVDEARCLEQTLTIELRTSGVVHSPVLKLEYACTSNGTLIGGDDRLDVIDQAVVLIVEDRVNRG